MEIVYEGTDEELDAFLLEHPEDDIVLPFKLSQERIAALDHEVEERIIEKSIVTMMSAGTTVVAKAKDIQHVVLAKPSEVPDEPATVENTDEHTG